MSDEAAAKPKKGKGGMMKLIIIGVGVLVLGGGGAAAGFIAAGSMKEEEHKEDPNKPVLVPRGQTAEAVAAAHGFASGGDGGHGGGGGGGGSHEAPDPNAPPHHPEDLPRPKNTQAYQATYYQIPTPFTSNLIDTDAFAQMTIAISTYYDQRVIAGIQTHELAIRSALLMMLAQQEESDLSTPHGKERLQGKMVKIINDVLKDKTGYSGVDNVYFTSFVIQ